MRPTERGDFTQQACAYERSRPGYPDQLLAAIAERVGATSGTTGVDLGAGTGRLSIQLAKLGLRVTALEPNAAMRRYAAVPSEIAWREGTFEATGLAGESYCWAVSGQAFHWADCEHALPEIARILVPGGHFTCIWYDRPIGDDPVLAWTIDLFRHLVPEFEVDWQHTVQPWEETLTETGHFQSPVIDEAEYVDELSAEDYLVLWKSQNRLSAAAGPERMRSLLLTIAEHLQQMDVRTVRIPYRYLAWTVRKVNSP